MTEFRPCSAVTISMLTYEADTKLHGTRKVSKYSFMMSVINNAKTSIALELYQ